MEKKGFSVQKIQDQIVTAFTIKFEGDKFGRIQFTEDDVNPNPQVNLNIRQSKTKFAPGFEPGIDYLNDESNFSNQTINLVFYSKKSALVVHHWLERVIARFEKFEEERVEVLDEGNT